MKKMFFGVFALSTFFMTSSFTVAKSLESNTKICNYVIKNSAGEVIDRWALEVPSNVDCGSDKAKKAALATWQLFN